ncbi:S8 family peptidase [Amycolatopsis sp. NPDC059027]|uniref:S8 family peptidase n=1 Tax=Amycolatopsis sp. NPDC059027 TaxID=3346709 RepID=UPI00366B4DDE
MTLRRGLGTAMVALVVTAAGQAPAQSSPQGVQPNPPSWGLDRIDQRTGLDRNYRYATEAADVTVYVIDSGVDAKHPDFEGRVAVGKDFLGDGTGTDTTDTNGHGTRLAGVAAGKTFGVAKKARIVPVRVIDKDGGGATEKIIAGIDWVRQNAHQPAVAVLGIGGAPNEKLDDAVRALAGAVPVAVPAGGSGSDASAFSPARVTEALTVAGSDIQDKASPRSNYGSTVDLYAPGVDIPGPVAGGQGASPLTGTSMSAAFVAGAAALYRSRHPQATAAQVADGLVAAASKNALSGVPDGTPNRLLYTSPA